MVKILMIIFLMSGICFSQSFNDDAKLTVATITARDSVNLFIQALSGAGVLTDYKMPIDTLKEWLDVSTLIAQYHRIDTLNIANTDWNLVPWDTLVASETTTGYTFNSDSTGFVTSFAGVVRVQGCVHFKNNGGASVVADVAVRALVNSNEARCLQTLETLQKNAAKLKALVYVGTVAVSVGDTLKVQYRVENADVDLEASAWFDDPVVASVNFERIN